MQNLGVSYGIYFLVISHVDSISKFLLKEYPIALIGIADKQEEAFFSLLILHASVSECSFFLVILYDILSLSVLILVLVVLARHVGNPLILGHNVL